MSDFESDDGGSIPSEGAKFMFEPYFEYVEAPGQGGRVLEHNSLFIKSEKQLCSTWAEKIEKPYRDLQHSGISLGFNGLNYWFSEESILGRIFSFIV